MEASIFARTDGYLARLHVDIGTTVTAGQLLAEIDAPELDQQLRCLLYTSDAADERSSVDLGGRRIIKKKNTAYNWVGRARDRTRSGLTRKIRNSTESIDNDKEHERRGI